MYNFTCDWLEYENKSKSTGNRFENITLLTVSTLKRSLFFNILVIIRSVVSQKWVINWVIIMTWPRSVFLFWAVVTLP